MMKQCLTILFIVGGVGLTPLSLLADASQRWHDPVKDLSIELNLSAEQAKQIKQVMGTAHQGSAEKMAQHMTDMAQLDARIMAVLSPDQQTQFKQLKLRRFDDRRTRLKQQAMHRLDRHLTLQDAQRQSIGVILDRYHAGLRPLLSAQLNTQDRVSQLTKLRQDRDAAIRALLTKPQLKLFDEFKDTLNDEWHMAHRHRDHRDHHRGHRSDWRPHPKGGHDHPAR